MASLKARIRMLAPLAALCIVLAGCSVGGTTSSASTTLTTSTAGQTATPIPCATHATSTGVVWSQASDKQIHGSVGGGALAILSAFAYPLASAAPGYTDFGPTQISLAADGTHMAVLQTQIIPNSDAPPQFILFTVDTTTHAVSRIANVGTRADLAGWADTKTLLYTQSPFWPSHVATENLHFYDIATHGDSTISGVKGVAKAEVRCSTLYWSEYTPASGIGTEKLHRYNLATHAEIGAPIDLGKAFRLPSEIAGPDSISGGGDWDVSADNTTLVWQRLDTVTAASGSDAPTIASTYQKAATDGSGAVAILAGAPADAYTRIANLSLAPVTRLLAVATGSLLLTCNPLLADPVRSYTPNSTFSVAPVWLPDGSGLLADIYTLRSTGPTSDLYQYSVSGALTGTLAHANASGADALP